MNDDDGVFRALADPTRRHLLDRLFERDGRTLTELESELEMTRFGVMKHLRVLEDAGLIERNKAGRVVSCELDAAPLQAASSWMSRYEKFWTEKLDSLARYLYQQEELQTWNKPGSPKSPRSTSSATIRSPRKKSGGPGPTRRR